MSNKYNIIKSEFDRLLKKHGVLTPEIIIDAAKDKRSKLHPFFEWNNAKAAHQWRLEQASMYLRKIKVTVERDGSDPVSARAFICIRRADDETDRGEYHPIERVLNDEEMCNQMLESAYSELRSFQRKYRTLRQLAPVMEAIDETLAVSV